MPLPWSSSGSALGMIASARRLEKVANPRQDSDLALRRARVGDFRPPQRALYRVESVAGTWRDSYS